MRSQIPPNPVFSQPWNGKNATFGLDGQVTGYVERTQKKGNRFERDADNKLVKVPYEWKETRHRSGMIHDKKGNLVSYFDKRSSTDKPAETEYGRWKGTFDGKNRLRESEEETTLYVKGVKSEVRRRSRTNITYNDLDLMTSYLDEREKRVVLDDNSLSSPLKENPFP